VDPKHIFCLLSHPTYMLSIIDWMSHCHIVQDVTPDDVSQCYTYNNGYYLSRQCSHDAPHLTPMRRHDTTCNKRHKWPCTTKPMNPSKDTLHILNLNIKSVIIIWNFIMPCVYNTHTVTYIRTYTTYTYIQHIRSYCRTHTAYL